MKHILVRSNVDLLAQLAWSNVLLAFDFDGTLAPIVDDRDAARMRARTRRLLRTVCQRYPCAVVSGRAYDDVLARLEGVPVRYVIGNHGLEPGDRLESYADQIAVLLPLLAQKCKAIAGVDIEDKRYSVAIHYRRARRKRPARAVIHDAIASLPVRTRVVPGKLVVNVLPDGAPHKGDALVRLREDQGADTALYVGDDVTDEDVFELDQPGRLVTIRVGLSRSSAASYYLRDQPEMDALLARLAALRDRQASS